MERINYYDDNSRENIFLETNANAFDYMDNSTKSMNDLIAMTYYGKEISYGTMKNTINLYANKLKNFGLQAGDKISLALPNIPELVIYQYAAWKLGIIVNLIEPRFNPKGIADMIDMCDSKLLITTGITYKDKIKSILPSINVEKIVVVNPTTAMNLFDIRNVLAKTKCSIDDLLLKFTDETFKADRTILNSDFIHGTKNDSINTVYFDDMDASIVFTSGTSGFPKGALFTHRAYNVKTRQISYGVPKIYPGDKFLAAIPFFSAYGSFAGMHNSLVKGMNMYMIPKFNPDEFGDLICKYQIQTAIGVPKYWDDFAKNWLEFKKKYKLDDLSFLVNPVTGGDIVSPKVIDNNNELYKKNNSQAKLIVGYGSTETSGPIFTTVDNPKFDNNKTTGIAFPGIDYILLDENMEIAKDNFGQLAVSDPAAMKKYFNNDKATDEITFDYNGKKYYLMGDLVEIDEKGMLYFKGRAKRAIMLPSGHTVHTLPIEEALRSSQIVEDVCAVGINYKDNDKYSGTIPVAFIVLKNGFVVCDNIVDALDELSLKNLPERNRAYGYVFVNELPYTLMGKVDYKALEKLNLSELDLHIVDFTFFPEKVEEYAKRRNKKY